jgi:signal transduction histidine kinase
MVRRPLQQLRMAATSALVMLTLSVLVPATLAALAGWWTYRTNQAAAELDARSAVDVLSEFTRHHLDDDVTLLHLMRDALDRPDADDVVRTALDVRQKLHRLLKFYPQVDDGFILDRDGNTLFSSSGFPFPGSGFAEGEAFRSLATTDPPLYVGAGAPAGSKSDQEVFLLALRRNMPDDAFTGMIGLLVSTADFRALFDRLAARRPATILLFRNDGAVLSRLPEDKERRLPATAPLLTHLHQASTGLFTTEESGGSTLYAYHSLGQYPLVVAYGISDASVADSWRPSFLVILAIAVAATIGLLTSSLAVLQGQREVRQRESRLEAEIQRRREAEAETRRSLEEALRANTAKSGFLAMMSHELRTPLNAIIGFSEMMTGELFGPLGSERYKSYVADIAQSGTHLLKVINDILDLSRIDLGRLKPDVGLTDIGGVLEQAVRMVTPIAAKAGVAIVPDLATDLPGVPADARLLKQALLNVLSNAIKFTPQGGSIHVLASHQADRPVVVEIRDTGIGMTQEQIQLALEPFVQVDNSLHRKYEGAGLGLPLAKAFIEVQGGRFEVESKPGRGTAVRFVLAAQPGAAVMAVTAAMPGRATGKEP